MSNTRGIIRHIFRGVQYISRQKQIHNANLVALSFITPYYTIDKQVDPLYTDWLCALNSSDNIGAMQWPLMLYNSQLCNDILCDNVSMMCDLLPHAFQVTYHDHFLQWWRSLFRPKHTKPHVA